MIITVSREFGSGGREVGKRLADALNYQYYDKEIVTEIAKSTDLTEKYVTSVLENGGFKNFAFNFGRSIPLIANTPDAVTDVLVAQQNIIKAIGKKGDCVIVGRCADVILRDMNPLRIFVYADEKSKVERCRKRAPEGENLTDKQLVKMFKQVDGGRRKLHELLASLPWGDKLGYDLMINTSGVDIKEIIPSLAAFAKSFNK